MRPASRGAPAANRPEQCRRRPICQAPAARTPLPFAGPPAGWRLVIAGMAWPFLTSGRRRWRRWPRWSWWWRLRLGGHAVLPCCLEATTPVGSAHRDRHIAVPPRWSGATPTPLMAPSFPPDGRGAPRIKSAPHRYYSRWPIGLVRAAARQLTLHVHGLRQCGRGSIHVRIRQDRARALSHRSQDLQQVASGAG
jgi:hypothetical protein